MALVFITPFILPLLLKLILTFKLFDNIEEFKNLFQIFNNMYTIIYIFIIIALLLWFFYKWEDLKEFLDKHNIKLGMGENKLIVEKALQEDADKKKMINEMQEDVRRQSSENNESIKNEAKVKLGLVKTRKEDKCKDCKKDEIENENKQLRYFAAYNVTNADTRTLLHIIYNENFINTNDFKNQIIEGYKKRNKRNVKFKNNDLEKIANNKYETIYAGLKFLNIIEPSEDDKIIKLTKTGKEFVKKYIEEQRGG